MRAIILVAGRGSRLPKSLSKNPKSFLKIGNKIILDRLIEIFNEIGINKIALVTGFKKKKFSRFKLKTFNNKNWKVTNMVYSLNKADSWLKKYNCIISYGDILYEKDAVVNLIKSHEKICVSYDTNWKKLWKKRFKNPLDDAETFKINSRNFITEIGKKTKNISSIKGQYMGLMKFNPSGWKGFKKCLKKDFKNKFNELYLTDVLQKLIDNQFKIKAVKYSGLWSEVDNFKDYSIIKKIFKR